MITLTYEGDHWEFWIDPDEGPSMTGMCIGKGNSIVETAENATKFLEISKEGVNACILEFCQQRLTGPKT